jgi:hypothetical protein
MEANQSLEKKNTAQKARIQILENEVKKVKESIQVALDKSNTDDQLIEALRSEISRLTGRLARANDEISQLKNKVKNGCQPGGGPADVGVQYEWSYKEQQYQNEIKRLERLCRNQVCFPITSPPIHPSDLLPLFDLLYRRSSWNHKISPSETCGRR